MNNFGPKLRTGEVNVIIRHYLNLIRFSSTNDWTPKPRPHVQTALGRRGISVSLYSHPHSFPSRSTIIKTTGRESYRQKKENEKYVVIHCYLLSLYTFFIVADMSWAKTRPNRGHLGLEKK